jgi:hypothetical protein
MLLCQMGRHAAALHTQKARRLKERHKTYCINPSTVSLLNGIDYIACMKNWPPQKGSDATFVFLLVRVRRGVCSNFQVLERVQQLCMLGCRVHIRDWHRDGNDFSKIETGNREKYHTQLRSMGRVCFIPIENRPTPWLHTPLDNRRGKTF